MRLASGIAVALLCCLAGCWETLSWSPGGRYLAFVNPTGSEPWRWDSRTFETERLPGGPAHQVFYLDSSEHMLFAYDHPKENDHWRLVFRNLADGAEHVVLPDTEPYMFAISPDAKRVYNIEPQEKSVAVFERSIANPDDVRELWQAPHELTTPHMGTPEQGLLFVAEEENQVYKLMRLRAGQTRPESIYQTNERDLFLPIWAGDDRILFKRESADEALSVDEWVELVQLTPSTGTTKVLHPIVYPFAAATLGPKGKRVVFTGVETHRLDEIMRDIVSSIQVLSIDLDTGDVVPLTNETFGAGYAAFQPGKNAIAYISPPGNDLGESTVRVLNLDTRDKRILWRNDAEHAFATSEHLYESGRPLMAKAAYERILASPDESPFRSPAQFRIAELNLTGPVMELDAARDMIESMDRDWRNQALDIFWRPNILVAYDRDSTWINPPVAADDEEVNRSQVDFDMIRARWSKSRLYLRVVVHDPKGYGKPNFENVHILIGGNQSSSGTRTIAPGVTWDRPVFRNLRIGYWRDNGSNTSHDIELSNENGDTLARLVNQGFEIDDKQPIQMYGKTEVGPERVAFELSISRTLIGMYGTSSAYLQAVALDGEGRVIDSFNERDEAAATGKVSGAAALLELD